MNIYTQDIYKGNGEHENHHISNSLNTSNIALNSENNNLIMARSVHSIAVADDLTGTCTGVSAEEQPFNHFGTENNSYNTTSVLYRETSLQKQPKNANSIDFENRENIGNLLNNKGLNGDSFMKCGQPFYICSNCCGHIKKVMYTCKSRICPTCSKRKQHKLYMKYMPSLRALQPRNVRLLTISLKSQKTLSRGEVRRLLDSWGKLRRSVGFKNHVKGGMRSLEVTKTENGFHLHLHAIIHGDYIPQKFLSEKWKKITGDSFIVDIRRSNGSPKQALGYVLKYINKPTDLKELNDLIDYSKVFKGIRTLHTFGSLFNVIVLKTQHKCEKCQEGTYDYVGAIHPTLYWSSLVGVQPIDTNAKMEVTLNDFK